MWSGIDDARLFLLWRFNEPTDHYFVLAVMFFLGAVLFARVSLWLCSERMRDQLRSRPLECLIRLLAIAEVKETVFFFGRSAGVSA